MPNRLHADRAVPGNPSDTIHTDLRPCLVLARPREEPVTAEKVHDGAGDGALATAATVAAVIEVGVQVGTGADGEPPRGFLLSCRCRVQCAFLFNHENNRPAQRLANLTALILFKNTREWNIWEPRVALFGKIEQSRPFQD